MQKKVLRSVVGLRRGFGVFLLLLVIAGCGAEGPSSSSRSSGAAPLRPDDGIATSPAVQAVAVAGAARELFTLIDATEDSLPEVRARAAYALASMKAVEAVDALVRLLDDPEPRVRADAAFALGRTGDGSALPHLVALLAEERDGEVRRKALDAIGRLPGQASADALLDFEPRDGSEEAARTLALSRLGGVLGVQHEGLRDHLFEKAADSDPTIRLSAARYFSELGGTRNWGTRAVFLRPVLDGYSTDDPAAMHLAEGLGMLHDFLDLDRLGSLAREATDWRVRAGAMMGLDPLSPSATILAEALDDPSPGVAASAAVAMSDGALPEVLADHVDRWVVANPDRLSIVRPLLVQAAESQRSGVVLGWVDQIDDGGEVAWQVGLEALAYLGGADAIARLERAVDDPSPNVATAAIEAVAARWEADRAVPATHDTYFRIFSTAIGHRIPEVVAGAREALLGSPLEARARSAGLDLTPMDIQSEPSSLEGGTEVDWSALAALGARPTLELVTGRGRIVIELFPAAAPHTVMAVSRLANEGRYDGVRFHRVVPLFAVQTGDLTRGDGTGDPGFDLPLELTDLPFDRGVVGVANLGEHDSGNSQFFIVQTDQLHLDADYTAFGRVIEGMEVVDAIELGDAISEARVVPGG